MKRKQKKSIFQRVSELRGIYLTKPQMTVYLKYKSKYLLHNASKNIRSTNETDLISETKLFLLKDNLRCAGCNENIEITDANGLKNVFIFDKCLDCYCEKCYRYIIENDIGCISCYE